MLLKKNFFVITTLVYITVNAMKDPEENSLILEPLRKNSSSKQVPTLKNVLLFSNSPKSPVTKPIDSKKLSTQSPKTTPTPSPIQSPSGTPKHSPDVSPNGTPNGTPEKISPIVSPRSPNNRVEAIKQGVKNDCVIVKILNKSEPCSPRTSELRQQSILLDCEKLTLNDTEGNKK